MHVSVNSKRLSSFQIEIWALEIVANIKILIYIFSLKTYISEGEVREKVRLSNSANYDLIYRAERKE